MKYNIVSKNDQSSLELVNFINEQLQANGFSLSDTPQLVLSIGGDGTMLRAIHKYLDKLENTAFLGIHTGTLGFFTNYTVNEVENLVHDLINNKPTFQEHKMLEIVIDKHIYYAVNELRIENIYHTQSIDMYINDEFLQTFKGNGVCLSTSAGSTGYNRSLNGPIVDGNLELMILCEIAGIHHREFKSLGSSLVMGANTNFKMCLKSNENAVFGIDYFTMESSNISEITCRLSNKTWKMANYNSFTYPQRLKRAFLD